MNQEQSRNFVTLKCASAPLGLRSKLNFNRNHYLISYQLLCNRVILQASQFCGFKKNTFVEIHIENIVTLLIQNPFFYLLSIIHISLSIILLITYKLPLPNEIAAKKISKLNEKLNNYFLAICIAQLTQESSIPLSLGSIFILYNGLNLKQPL